jgi:hypothetical protein
VTLERVVAELAQISGRLEDLYPESNTGKGMAPVPLHETIVGDVRVALLVLFVGMGPWPVPAQLLVSVPLLFTPYVLADIGFHRIRRGRGAIVGQP